MELLQLTYFCHAAKYENFSRTAESFNVPTSNISRSIRCLEKELGAKLFDRSANRIALNEAGRIFYAHVSRALSELESGRLEVGDVTNTPKGEIRLLISSCRRIVTQAIELCRKQYPQIRFTVKHGVDDGDYDFVISDIPPQRGRFKRHQLMTENMYLAVPDSFALCGSRTPVDDMSSEPFISLGKGTRLHAITVQLCRSWGFEPDIAIQTDDPYYVRKYLEMGLGIAFYPERSWADLEPKGVTFMDIGAPNRTIYAFSSVDREGIPAHMVFLEILKQAFREA